MPTVLRIRGYRFFFYPYDCSEPRHMHVSKERKECTFWLDPVELEFNHGFSTANLREIEKIVEDNVETLRREWDFFCKDANP